MDGGEQDYPSASGGTGPTVDAQPGKVWVFGYGSLMWNPGFRHDRREVAVFKGWHRAYQMYSTRNRGTPDLPGMVLSMAPGGQCTGVAYRIAAGHEEEVLAYLDKREGVGRAHRRVVVPVGLTRMPQAPLLPVETFLPILSYSNYIPRVPPSRQSELVAKGRGSIGTSYEYLRRLMEEVDAMGIEEPVLQRLLHEATLRRNGGAH